MDKLIAAIMDVRDKLRQGVYKNEDHVSKMVVMRLLNRLGWDVDDPRRVSSEFRIGTKRVDYALRHGPLGSAVLIEVKGVGKATPASEDQLFDYCFREGVPLAVLTDGPVWNFYRPAGRGRYEDRCFASADLAAGEAADRASMLHRYLAFDVVASGQFEENVQSDYMAHQRRIAARLEFPAVLESLIAKADPRVVAVFCEEVERRCGFRPDNGDAESYLRSKFPQLAVAASESGSYATLSQSALTPGQKAARTRRLRREAHQEGLAPLERTESASFVLHGKSRTFSNNEELIEALFTEFANGDPSFCEKLATHVGVLRQRREDFRGLSYDRARALPGGWWINVVGTADTQLGRIRKACMVAGVEYGSELTVNPKRTKIR